MNADAVIEGITIGAAGGAIAGLTVSLVSYIHSKVVETVHKRRIHRWLNNHVKDDNGQRHRSTRTIASYNNLTEDRVRYICSLHQDIYLSIGEREDMWGLYGIGREKPKQS